MPSTRVELPADRRQIWPPERSAEGIPAARRLHVPALDGVRGLAILLVMWLHFFAMQTGHAGILFRVVQKTASLGQAGVDLFFVLSGFLITGILLDSKESPRFFRSFYVRRVLRIFPLYFGFLGVLYLLGPLLRLWPPAPLRDQLWFWSYLQNIGQTFIPRPLDGPAHFWSLSVEEHFYLFWPLLVHRLRVALLSRVLLGLVCVAVLSRVILIHLGYGTFYFTICRLDGLSIGSLLAVLQRDPEGLSWLRPYATRVLIASAAAFPLFLALTGRGLNAVQIVKSTAVAVTCAAVLVLALSPTGLVRTLFQNVLLRSFGKFSYGIYVLHGVTFGLYARYVHLASPLLGLVAAFAGTWAVCAVVWHVWERPFLRLKDRFAG